MLLLFILPGGGRLQGSFTYICFVLSTVPEFATDTRTFQKVDARTNFVLFIVNLACGAARPLSPRILACDSTCSTWKLHVMPLRDWNFYRITGLAPAPFPRRARQMARLGHPLAEGHFKARAAVSQAAFDRRVRWRPVVVFIPPSR